MKELSTDIMKEKFKDKIRVDGMNSKTIKKLTGVFLSVTLVAGSLGDMGAWMTAKAEPATLSGNTAASDVKAVHDSAETADMTEIHGDTVSDNTTETISANGLLGEADADKVAPVTHYPIEITGDAGTNYTATGHYAASSPQVISFFDYKGFYNVAYMDGDYLKIQRYDSSSMAYTDTVRIPRKYPYFGNVISDSHGYYYVAWGQTDSEGTNCTTISVAKYTYQGAFVAECAFRGNDTGDDEWGTKTPFHAGNCSMAINNGVVAVNYGRLMYSGHQSNYIIYVDSATMTGLSGSYAYCSHSFDQRMVPTSDGGFLALNQGDYYNRSFHINRINADRKRLGQLWNFHFSRTSAYNFTLAQLGSIVETGNAYVFCGSSERTLSLDSLPYYSHGEARDLFIQIVKKDFYNYSGEEQYRVSGSVRVPVGTPSESFPPLTGKERDYGVLWLTGYEGTHYVANPKIVALDDSRFAVMWEKRAYSNTNNVETYYAIMDENGSVVKEPVCIAGTYLAGNIDPVYREGRIYWTTSDANGEAIHCLNPFGPSLDRIKVTGVQIPAGELTINVGEPVNLNASVLPADASDKGLKYTTSSSWIATVNERGVVTGNRAGTATITIKSNENPDFQTTCKLTVLQPMKELTFDNEELKMMVGDSQILYASYSPGTTSNKNLQWSNSNPEVISIQKYGSYGVKISALATGSAKLTCGSQDGTNLTADIMVNVYVPAESIRLSETSVTISAGDTYTLKAAVEPVGKADQSVTYASENENIATVSPEGVIIAKAAGQTRIKASTTDGTELSARCSVTVKEKPKKDNNDKDDTDTGSTGTEKAVKTKTGKLTIDTSGRTAKYTGPVNQKASQVSIPSTVKYDGVTYKVTAVAEGAFKGNANLKKVTIGSNVTTIGKNAFANCKKLKTITMGKKVKTIGDKAFYKCIALTKIKIPGTVNKIGKQAFYGCKKLKSITISTKKLTTKNVGSKAFKGIYSKATIKVPKAKLKAYKTLLKKKGVGRKVKIKK